MRGQHEGLGSHSQRQRPVSRRAGGTRAGVPPLGDAASRASQSGAPNLAQRAGYASSRDITVIPYAAHVLQIRNASTCDSAPTLHLGSRG